MIVCDGEMFLWGSGFVRFTGLAISRVECWAFYGITQAALRDSRGGFFPLANLGNFREAAESPQAKSLISEAEGFSLSETESMDVAIVCLARGLGN